MSCSSRAFTTDMILRIPYLFLLPLLVAARLAGSQPLLRGPYHVQRRTYKVDTLHPDDPSALVVFPTQILSSDRDGQRFPLLVFGHGKFAGGARIVLALALLEIVASHGFVVIGPRSCDRGCDLYYMELLKTIEWAQDMMDDQVLRFIDHDRGYGLYGYSMGGLATAEALGYADQFNIKAGLIIHPARFSPVFPLNISTPLAAFTGTDDSHVGGVENTRLYYDAAPFPKVLASIQGANHYYPLWRYLLHPYMAAWFKIYIEGDSGYYYNLIYGDSPDSLCSSRLLLSECEAILP